MKKFREHIVEMVAGNNAGGGAIDGIGVGAKGEPGVSKSAHRRHKRRNNIMSRLITMWSQK